MRVKSYHYLFLLAIPVLIFAIAFIQVKGPIIIHLSFPTAIHEHNKALVNELVEKPSNASESMYKELNRLKLSLRGHQDGEKTDIKMVLHASMGIGDRNLPNRIEWMPALLCCFTTIVILTVIIAVYMMAKIANYMSNMSTSGMGRDHISSSMDLILRKRKIENPHQPVEKTETSNKLITNNQMAATSTRVSPSIAPTLLPLLILLVAILIQASILLIVQGGGMAIKLFGIFRRAASLSPMMCETVLDHIILVLNFPTQIVFYMALARVASSFNGLFYFIFGKELKEAPLLVTQDLF